ncbi:MAG: type I secretion system permease/ATPase [Alphaproteobacteria bacterium]|nr:type I secretion system permease/ATPase [Alphaproteobacteria bacterium]
MSHRRTICAVVATASVQLQLSVVTLEIVAGYVEFIGWQNLLKYIHYAGLAITLTAVLSGDGLAVRTLFTPGPTLSARTVWLIHSSVVLGMCLLFLSGSALIVTRHTFAALPAHLVLKLGAAIIVSVNALLLQHYLIPLAQRRVRPLALSLSWPQILLATTIGATSVACWTAITAVAFIPQLHKLSAANMYMALVVLWAGLVLAALLISAFLRVLNRLMLLGTAKASQPGDREEPTRHTAMVAQKTATLGGQTPTPPPTPRVVPIGLAKLSRRPASLTERIRNLVEGQPLNDNPRDAAGERIERERIRASMREAGMERNAVNGQAGGTGEDRLWNSARSQPQQATPKPGTGDAPDGQSGQPASVGDVRKACRKEFFGAAVVSFFSNLLMLTGPLFMLQVYDRVLTSKSVPTLWALFALVVVLFVFMGVLDFLRSRLLVRIGLRVDRLLGAQTFDLAIAVSDPERAREQSQLLKDLQQVRQFVSGAGMTSIFDMPWAPLYFLVVFMFHWALGIVALIGAVVLVSLSLINEALSKGPVAQAATLAAESERKLEGGRRNNETLHAMGMQRIYRNRWIATHCDELLVQTKAADVAGLLSVLTKTSRLLLQSGMLATGAILVLQNQISAGVMIAASIIMSRALAPIELAIAHWRGFIAARQGLRRLDGEFNGKQLTNKRLNLPTPEGHLAVENVFAGALGERDPILKGLSFSLTPGDALGVLGPSGSGKSTLARVLVGVWPCLRGTVRLDGAALAHWPGEQLGDCIGYLPQSAELLDGTVAENIGRFDPAAEPSEIIAAAQLANVHELIQALPEGYNSRVGEGGAALSGGQRQRIGLARAMFRQPALLVLDEPNSNLDNDGERALAKAIADLRRAGRTVVIIAHRKSVLTHVNKVLVLNEGRQAAFGSKNDIIKSLAMKQKGANSRAAKTAS